MKLVGHVIQIIQKKLLEIHKNRNVAEHFNDYFVTVAEKLVNKLVMDYPDCRNNDFYSSIATDLFLPSMTITVPDSI
jgi:hypothetical protein